MHFHLNLSEKLLYICTPLYKINLSSSGSSYGCRSDIRIKSCNIGMESSSRSQVKKSVNEDITMNEFIHFDFIFRI